MLIRARHYATGELIDVECDAGQIVAVGPAGKTAPDRTAGWVAPAFFDLQINGCGGVSFNSPKLTIEGVHRVADVCRAHGIAEFLPTLVTNSFDAISHGFATLTRARNIDADIARAVPGFHLEGPYISADDGPRGAHPKAHVREPDWDEFQRW